jgi:hypothetical protein
MVLWDYCFDQLSTDRSVFDTRYLRVIFNFFLAELAIQNVGGDERSIEGILALYVLWMNPCDSM